MVTNLCAIISVAIKYINHGFNCKDIDLNIIRSKVKVNIVFNPHTGDQTFIYTIQSLIGYMIVNYNYKLGHLSCNYH